MEDLKFEDRPSLIKIVWGLSIFLILQIGLVVWGYNYVPKTTEYEREQFWSKFNHQELPLFPKEYEIELPQKP